jgi:hypothetical protein
MMCRFTSVPNCQSLYEVKKQLLILKGSGKISITYFVLRSTFATFAPDIWKLWEKNR